jgi:hypothetical protein
LLSPWTIQNDNFDRRGRRGRSVSSQIVGEGEGATDQSDAHRKPACDKRITPGVLQLQSNFFGY